MTELSQRFKLVTAWLVAGTLLFLAVQAWLSQREATRFTLQGTQVEIRRGADGHYHWPGRINGREVDFLVDTGASGTAVPLELARELGLPMLGSMPTTTAGGPVQGQVVLIELQLQGGLKAERLRATALPGLRTPLIGMDVLGRLRLRQEEGVLHVDLPEGAP